ncbi:hypothetical protein FS749_008884 [Ceratobasidium sp. UAMH 11750]|nr:hypothetical protein FS749_008884 [Ceratobasidium sp. UAMH 11750]
MFPWVVTALFSNVSTALKRSVDSHQDLESLDVSLLLKEIDKLLGSTSKLLKTHQTVLPDEEYESFQAQHRTYRWMFSDEERNLEKINNATDRDAFQDRATQLLDDIKTYRDSLLEASRHAAVITAPAFPDEAPAPADTRPTLDAQPTPPIERTTPTVNIPTRPEVQVLRASPFRPPSPPRTSRIAILPSSVGLMGKLRTANTFLSPRVQAPEPGFIERQGFAIAVAHILRDPTQNLYERLVSVKMGDQQLEIPDPKLHVLEPHQVTVDDKALAAAFILVGEFMLSPEKFQKTVEQLQREID